MVTGKIDLDASMALASTSTCSATITAPVVRLRFYLASTLVYEATAIDIIVRAVIKVPITIYIVVLPVVLIN